MKLALAVLATLAFTTTAQAHDAFDAVRCGGDIPKALIGKVMSNDTVVATEAAYKAIGLHDDGGQEVNDHLSEVSWRMCGANYNILVDDKSVVRDVLLFPAHSRAMPEFSGICKRDGKDLAYAVDAVLDNRKHVDPNPDSHTDSGPPLPALTAWRIDETHAKYISVPAAGLMCPREGIFTMDGGG
jgi:hypothetical protein